MYQVPWTKGCSAYKVQTVHLLMCNLETSGSIYIDCEVNRRVTVAGYQYTGDSSLGAVSCCKSFLPHVAALRVPVGSRLTQGCVYPLRPGNALTTPFTWRYLTPR